VNASGQLLDTLTPSEIFQNYERAYSEATGIPVTLRPVETWQLPFRGRRKENGWCALMDEKSRTYDADAQGGLNPGRQRPQERQTHENKQIEEHFGPVANHQRLKC